MSLRLIGILLFTCFSQLSWGQKKVSIIKSNTLDFDAQLADAQRLIGDVILKYDEVLMYCDSAYLFANEDFDAFGNIRIQQGDTLQLFGETLKFTAADRMARIRRNIRMQDRDMTLITNELDYNLDSEVAYYYNGGTIQSRKNNNVLSSVQGYYDSRSENFHFRKNVELKNPEYTVLSDTLRYNPNSERAFFYGPTRILSGGTKIYCRNGWYDTRYEVCQFNKDATIHSGSNILKGDSIYYNGRIGIGEVIGNVFISDTTSTYFITGDYGWHRETDESSFVTGNALMTQAMEGDSLFLHADTLKAVPDTLDLKRIMAYKGVRLYKSDLQGKCDSLSYSERDSLIRFYQNPVLWSQENQLSGDTILIKTYGGKIEKLFMNWNAFIASEVYPGTYNQIKGRYMTGTFRENELRNVLVKGNGHAIYFTVEEEEGRVVAETGANKVECSDIEILVNGNQVEKIKFLVLPSGQLKPQSKLTAEDRVLEDFRWYGPLRPLSKSDLFNDPEVPLAEAP